MNFCDFYGDNLNTGILKVEKKVAGTHLPISYASKYQFIAWQHLFYTLIAGKSTDAASLIQWFPHQWLSLLLCNVLGFCELQSDGFCAMNLESVPFVVMHCFAGSIKRGTKGSIFNQRTSFLIGSYIEKLATVFEKLRNNFIVTSI